MYQLLFFLLLGSTHCMHISQFIHLLTVIWVDFRFSFCKKKNAAMNMCVQVLYGHMFLFSWVHILEYNGQIISQVFVNFYKTPSFCKWLYHSVFSTSSSWEPQFIFSPYLIWPVFWFYLPNTFIVVSYCGFNLHLSND